MHHGRLRFTLAAITAAIVAMPILGCTPTASRADKSPMRPSTAADRGEAPTYPHARRVAQTDTYHGTKVADPYRWMENEADPDLAPWLDAQEALWQAQLGPTSRVAGLESRIERIRAFDRPGLLVRGGTRYFFVETPAGAQHGVLKRRDRLDGRDRSIVDFADLVPSPTHRMVGIVPSPDGKTIAWAQLSPAGWGTLGLLDAEGKAHDVTMDGVAGASAVWTHDSRGFFYLGYGRSKALDEGAEPRVQLRHHRLGTSPDTDRVLYEEPDDPRLRISHQLSADGRFLVIHRYRGSFVHNGIAYLDLEGGVPKTPRWITLVDDEQAADDRAAYTFEANEGRRFLVRTTLDAPRGRLVAVDLDRPARDRWQTVIPQRAASLGPMGHIGGRLVVTSTLDARPNVEIFRLDGTLETTVTLPQLGLLTGFADDLEATNALYRLNNLTDPGTVYRLDVETGASEVVQRATLAFDPDDFVLTQHFYASADGTRVPIYLAHRRDLDRRQRHPVFMYGYGHGGWRAFPWFQPHLVAWLELGGVYAMPGLRGGGEYGAAWQEAGTRRNKQNTIDDFLAAAQWLVDEGYTTPGQLVANGGSASGVLAAAAVVQRPDLFGAALVEYPFVDMLRYQHFTAIKGWTEGYGTSDDADDFAVLARYSPLHNLDADTCYPPIVTIVAGEDSSTAPMHGHKWAAALQHHARCANPYLLKHLPGVGHYSYGRDPATQTRTQAEIVALLAEAIDWSPTPTISR